MSNPQNRPQKRCACGRGSCFTDNRPGTHRDEEGNFICSFCVFDDILNKAKATVAVQENLERRAD